MTTLIDSRVSLRTVTSSLESLHFNLNVLNATSSPFHVHDCFFRNTLLASTSGCHALLCTDLITKQQHLIYRFAERTSLGVSLELWTSSTVQGDVIPFLKSLSFSTPTTRERKGTKFLIDDLNVLVFQLIEDDIIIDNNWVVEIEIYCMRSEVEKMAERVLHLGRQLASVGVFSP
ncbi:hypothetical protein RCL1_005128 [Eukaryota sp. TZLM3-RCL]